MAFSGTKKSPKSGTHQQTYPHIHEINPAARFYQKITGQSNLCTSLTDSAQFRMLFAYYTSLSARPVISQQYCELQS